MGTECYDAVKEFCIKFGQPVFKNDVTKAIRDLRIRLLLEELGETVVAWQEKDKIGLADGLADLLYVTTGAAVSCLDSKVNDPWSFVEPNIRHKPTPVVELAMVVTNLCNAIHIGHTSQVLCIQVEIVMETIYRVAVRHGIPLRDCFIEVHKSNMTKDVIQLNDGQKGGYKGASYRPPNLALLLEL